MGQALEALHRLQAVEIQLAQIRRTRGGKVRRFESHKRQVRQVEEKLQESRLTFRTRQKRLDALQLDIAAREESINKHRQALNQAKTNKEYAAILTAMNTEKADNAKIETEILQLIEETQNLKDEAAKIEAEQAKLLENVARAEKALYAYDAESQSEHDDLQAQRDECSEKIPPTMLAIFTRVAKHHDGEAIVPATKLRPKREEYICSGCNMTLTLEVINMLQTNDEIQICKVCGRILYLEVPQTHSARG